MGNPKRRFKRNKRKRDREFGENAINGNDGKLFDGLNGISALFQRTHTRNLNVNVIRVFLEPFTTNTHSVTT